MKNPTVLEITEAYLKEHGYDGLYCEDWPCGCRIGDLAPCGRLNEECCAGYAQPGGDIGPTYTIRCPQCNAVCSVNAAECLECGAVWT